MRAFAVNKWQLRIEMLRCLDMDSSSKKMGKIIGLMALSILILAGCTSMGEHKMMLPPSKDDIDTARVGKLTGEDGIVISANAKSKSPAADAASSTQSKEIAKVGVNEYLWRASLEKVKSMPLLGVDPASGLIITDWQNVSGNTSQRYKFDIRVTGTQLQAHAVHVSAFKQVLKGATWHDAKVQDSLAFDLEKSIIARARELKVHSDKK